MVDIKFPSGGDMTVLMRKEQAERVLTRFARDVIRLCRGVGIEVTMDVPDPSVVRAPIHNPPFQPLLKDFEMTGDPGEMNEVKKILEAYHKSEVAFDNYWDSSGDLLVWKGDVSHRCSKEKVEAQVTFLFGYGSTIWQGEIYNSDCIPGIDDPVGRITDLMDFPVVGVGGTNSSPD